MSYKEKIAGMSLMSMVTMHAAIVLISGSLWMVRGDYIGSIAGGICFGLMYEGATFFGKPKGRLDPFMMPLLIIILLPAIYLKNTHFMPEDWEPARFQDGAAILTFFAMSFLALMIGEARNPDLALQYTNEADDKQDAVEHVDEEQDGPLTRFEIAAKVFGIFCMTTSLVVSLALIKPDWISTQDIALDRYIVGSIIDYDNKTGLTYELGSNTTAKVENLTETENGFVATLHLHSPLPMIDLSKYKVDSRQALMAYLDIRASEREFVDFKGQVTFEKNLLGWKVVNSDIDITPEYLSRAYKDGRLPGAKLSKGAMLFSNPLGMEAFMRSPNMMLVIILLISAAMLVMRRQIVANLMAGILPVAFAFAPIVFSLLSVQ